MKTLEFETSKGRFMLVDDPILPQAMSITTKYIKLYEITEEQASEIVDDCKDFFTLDKGFFDYLKDYSMFDDAIKSLHSLLKSKGIHLFENYYADKIGITYFDYHRNKSEQKTFYNPYIFKL